MPFRLAIPAPDTEAAANARQRVDGKAKPPGALGRIEDLSVRLAALIGRDPGPLAQARLIVFAGDHGLNQEGVSAYPSAVTQAMVATLLAGKASANAFAAAVGCGVMVADAGVDAELAPHPALIAAKVRRGTRNAAREPALTEAEAVTALEVGARIARDAQREGVEVLCIGEMGIGNSASAALLLHRLGPCPLADAIGQGAGHDAAGMSRKAEVLGRAAARFTGADPFETARQFGGLEILMMAGCMLGAAEVRLPVLVDGFISSSAALLALRLQPEVRAALFFSHCSAEKGHRIMLDAAGAEPLLDLNLRLGEGTGALLALPLLRAASHLLSDVASLDDVLAGRI